ncbi:hypothetical protein ASPFODRAFT_148805 [Aspergillus luchuensis CBS 106.47]|uniref:Major facilitator superfamily (MFS) profile domain-containing protein n=1 Tax=Aspergillus luchuensis (strain CBS 106.47) TaxID=1137211 RepID=A0A1M3SYT3_ASPLC|nr:hypothetical protein ASPFODRAFT_148805 [Aspergillus luchuensis CBS 106.47]
MPSILSNESSSLLSPNIGQGGSSTRSHDGKSNTFCHFSVTLPYLFTFLAFEIALILVATPMRPIQEDIICRKHYPGALAASSMCKSDIVQSELSLIKGWEATFGLLPGMITAVPYGMAAERYGRRPVLGLSLLGISLSQAVDIIVCYFPEAFSLRLIWLGAALTLVGGGPLVTTTMLFLIASDVTSEAHRSTSFFYLSAIPLIGQLLAAPLTYAAMAKGNWFSVLLGFGGLVVSTLAILVTPETHSMRHSDSCDDYRSSVDYTSPPLGVRALVVSVSRQAAVSVRTVFWSNKLSLLLMNFLFTSISESIPPILMQYVTKRFQWTWAEAALLNSISAGVRLAVVGLLLPFASRVLLLDLRLNPSLKDLWLARAGISALVVGAFGIGLADRSIIVIISLMIYSLGFGYGPAMRGLLITIAEGQRASDLLMCISLIESTGLLLSGPLLAASFRVGMALRGVWIGLPFILVGCCLACATAIVIGIRIGGEPHQASSS